MLDKTTKLFANQYLVFLENRGEITFPKWLQLSGFTSYFHELFLREEITPHPLKFYLCIVMKHSRSFVEHARRRLHVKWEVLCEDMSSGVRMHYIQGQIYITYIHLLVLITAIIFSTYNYIYATHSEIIGAHNKLKAMHIIYLTTFAKIRFERDSNSILLNSQPRSHVALGS